MFSINFSKVSTNFCLSLYYNGDNSYSFVNGQEIYNLKASNENNNFPAQLCLRSISHGFSANVYDFSVGFKSTDRSDILKIHKHLMTKYNIK